MKSLRFAPHWDAGCPDQVIGLITLINDILAATPAASRWLEIGSYAGESATIFLGFPQIKRLDCVDSWEAAVATVRSRLTGQIAAGRCRVHHATSAAFAARGGEWDVVYIDGDHSYESVRADIAAFAGMITPSGFLAGHDYHSGFPGVIQAVDEWRGSRPLQTYVDGSWCVRMAV